jgi:hypothetical protein
MAYIVMAYIPLILINYTQFIVLCLKHSATLLLVYCFMLKAYSATLLFDSLIRDFMFMQNF